MPRHPGAAWTTMTYMRHLGAHVARRWPALLRRVEYACTVCRAPGPLVPQLGADGALRGALCLGCAATPPALRVPKKRKPRRR
jgi:hypothetical protein